MATSVFSRRVFFRRGAMLAAGAFTVGYARMGRGGATDADFSRVPGVVINHAAASRKTYVGSPAIAILPNGDYVASHDWFGPATKRDTSVVFRSADQGHSWKPLAELKGQYWSSLFVHEGKLYLLGPNRAGGEVVIRRSEDGGSTWTSPDSPTTGLLLAEKKFHCAPVPVVLHQGRLWRAMEDLRGPGGWGTSFRAFMMSAPADADLLRAECWTTSNRLGHDRTWLDGKFGGWLEGNAVVAPGGQMVNMLRVDYRMGGQEKAAIVRVSADGKQSAFAPENGFVAFPGGCKKFTVRHDAKSGLYWTLSNYVPKRHWDYNTERARNTSVLMASRDLRTWEARCAVLYGPDIDHHAFQYTDWQFDGDDIAAVFRTAYDDGLGGAVQQHDANFLTFKRIARFRSLRPEDSVEPWLADDLRAYNSRLVPGSAS